MGTILIEKAEFVLEDQTLETLDSDFINLCSIVWTDANQQ